MKVKIYLILLVVINLHTYAQISYTDKQYRIQHWLHQHKVYDSTTQVHYVFHPLPANRDSLGVAQQEKVFYAAPDKILVYLNNKNDSLLLTQYGITIGKKVAVDVYEIETQTPFATKKQVEKITKKNIAVFAYWTFTNCEILNDSQNGNLVHLFDGIWTVYGIFDAPTHDIDSVMNWRNMHINYSNSNPAVVVNILDGGINETNPDFQGRLIWKWNMTNNSANLVATNHGSSVTGLAAATANNNYGGVGLWDGPVRMFQTSADGITINVAHLYVAMDSLISLVNLYPNQRQINNFSFGSGNDPVFRAKLNQLYNHNNRKGCFFQAGSGNSGTEVSWPARWYECTGWGATNSITYPKAIWSSSNFGDSLDFVNDGQNVKGMQADGSFATINGTSFSTPLGTGTVANIVALDTSFTNDDVREILKEGAKDLGVTGFDPVYGWGWARTGVSLKIACVRHVPTTFDAGGNVNYTYTFTPKYYNRSFLTNRKCYYPNGSPVPAVTNPDGTVSFTVILNPSNGFTATNNMLRYEFANNGCVTTIYTKPFSIMNLGGTTAIRDPQNPSMLIRIAPNPASHIIQLSGFSFSKNYSYSLADQTGRVLLTGIISQTSSKQIAVQNLPQGVYLFRLFGMQQKKLIGTEKIVILR